MFSRRWALVGLSCVEVLTATGIMFGWSSLTLALRREGIYDELCDVGESGCKEQVLRLSMVYTAGAVAIPLSGLVWGPLLDARGAKTCRLLGRVSSTISTACV
jgi:MFS family permease